nr:SIR2 family protein [uncultured Cohaesibacter sp.]
MDFDSAIQKIKLGRAICFLGAGFSRGAIDASGRPIFGERELREELFRISGEAFDEYTPLADIANYCQKKNEKTSQALSQTVLERFTLVQPTEYQKEILSQPWRSTFTTNYDDIPEQVWHGEHIQIFSPIDPEKTLLSGRRLFYMHGRGRDIRQRDIDPCLILSSSEYAKSNKSHQKLRDYFTNEMATSEAIVFIGYSAHDLDSTRSLASIGGHVKERTIFIEAPDIRPIDRIRIEEYGTIAPIGTQGFAKALRETHVPEVLSIRPRLVREITLDESARTSPKEASDKDIHQQLLTGIFNSNTYISQIQNEKDANKTSPSCVIRHEKLERTFQLLKSGNMRIVVTADIGNGKSFFLRQVEQRGLDEGYRVFRIDGAGTEYSTELQSLFQKKEKKLFIVDDSVRYRYQIELIGKRINGDCGLIISNSIGIDKIGIYDLREVVNGQVFEVSLDKMTTQEVNAWAAYLDRWGLWGVSLGGSNDTEKRDYIIRECGAEVRSVIVGTYKNAKIANRISNIVDFFLVNSKDKNNLYAFIGAIITSLVDKHVAWKNVVDWLGVNEKKFIKELQESRVNEILIQENEGFVLPSKQLARFFLETDVLDTIEANDIADIYVSIVLGTARQLTDPRHAAIARQNLKELMRFRILILLFGESNGGLQVIASIYNKLSSDRYIQKIDQFWLQFAMARMADEDLELAETYLNNAMGIAKGHGQGWETKQIEDQLDRLWLRKAIVSVSPNNDELMKAIKHLEEGIRKSDGDIIYPLRSAKLIDELLEKHIDEIDLDTCQKLGSLVKTMRDAIGKTGRLPGSERGESEVLRKHIRNIGLILQGA